MLLVLKRPSGYKTGLKCRRVWINFQYEHLKSLNEPLTQLM